MNTLLIDHRLWCAHGAQDCERMIAAEQHAEQLMAVASLLAMRSRQPLPLFVP